MLSSNKKTYLETLLCNKAYCLIQIGNVEGAKKVYESVVAKYPKNNVASSALRTIAAIQASVNTMA
jgi:TolA-binding protein